MHTIELLRSPIIRVSALVVALGVLAIMGWALLNTTQDAAAHTARDNGNHLATVMKAPFSLPYLVNVKDWGDTT